MADRKQLALSKVIAERFWHQSCVHRGHHGRASWQLVAEAAGGDAGQMREDYIRYVHAQRTAHEQDPGGKRGFSAQEYAAAVRAAAAANGRAA